MSQINSKYTKFKNILVIGMARSGTSLTASIFAKKGYFVAEDEKDLKEGNEFNPTGFFEAETVINKNREIYKAIGYEHDNTWMFDPITEEQVTRLKGLQTLPGHKELVDFYNQNGPWLWKDPRLCYTLRYWWPLMDQNTAVLLVRRDPAAIFNSFLRTKWRKPTRQDREETYQRIAQHMQAAEETIKELAIPCAEINYEDFQVEPEKICRIIEQTFGVTLDLQELNYNSEYNHNSLRGKLSTHLDLLLNKMPKSWIRTIKKFTPGSLLRIFFPERERG